MIRRSLREWGCLTVREDGPDSVSRLMADSLIAAARTVGVRGEGGNAILIDRHRYLQAQQMVGVLAAPRVTLEILPKIDTLDDADARHNLIHMLAQVLDLKVLSGAMTDLSWQRHDLLEILISLFCNQLFDAVRRGLARQYVGETADLTALRGRLDVQRQFTVLTVSPQKLACRYQELSPNIALNQIMKAAVRRLLHIAVAPENQRRLSELAFAFVDVDTPHSDQLPWDRVVLDRTNLAWGSLLNFARLILGQHFQTTTIGEERGFSLIFEMNTLFEEYIGRMMRRALVGSGRDVRLQGPQDHALSESDGTPRFATRPDIVVSRDRVPELIVDTKWKRLTGAMEDPRRGVGQADVYQMMAYSRIYGCNRLMLLYPHHNELGVGEGRLGTYQIRGAGGVTLTVASVSLSDLPTVRTRLKDLVDQELGT